MSKDIRRVALYNAATKKQKTVTLRRSNFQSDEEMDAYIRKLKEDNKLANKHHREETMREHIEKTIAAEPVREPGQPMTVDTSPLDIKYDDSTGNTTVIYGSSKRGKTTLMMHLYEKYFLEDSKKYITTLFSGNPHLNIYEKDKNMIIGYGFNDRSARYVQMEQYVNVKTKNRYRFLNLFDDIVDSKHSPIINKLILTYRNAQISSIICLQYVFLLSKQNRASVNNTFVFGSNTAEDEKNIIDALLRPYLLNLGLKSLQEQLAFYRAATRDHGFIYLDNIRNKMTLHRLTL